MITAKDVVSLGFKEFHSGILFTMLNGIPVILTRTIEKDILNSRDIASHGFMINMENKTYYTDKLYELKKYLNL